MSVFTPDVTITNVPLPVDTTGQTINVGNFPATQNVAVTSSVEVEVKNDTGNPVPVSFTTSALTPTVTRVAVSTTVATLAAADSNRKRLIIVNESGTLFVKLGTGATSTDYTYYLTANSTLDIDYAQTAEVTAIKQSGNTNVQVTSLS